MGNPHSKATEQMPELDVPPCVAGRMEGTNLDDYPPDIIPVADVVDEINPSRPGLMEGTKVDDYNPEIVPVSDVVDNIYPSRPGLMELTKVDDYNPEIVPVSDVVDNIYPSRPGMHSTPSERVILEKTEQPVLNLITGNPAISALHNEASLPAISNLTRVYATNVASGSNVALDAPARDAFESLPVSDATSQHMTTGAVMNVVRKNMKKPLTAEKREEINARRRANYRKKKEEGTVKFQDENQPILTVSELATIQCNMEERRELINARRRAGYCKKSDKGTTKLRDVAQNVPQTPFADITNGYQQTSVILDEKKEQVKARRRAAYRRKKDEAVVKQQDENLPALTISANPTTSSYTSLSQDDGALPPSTIVTSGVINDNVLARRQRDNERKYNLTDGQREQTNARRRSNYRKKMDEGTLNVKKKNEQLREWRTQHPTSMTPQEQGESSAQRKAKYAARKYTPCAESIAMPHPDLASTTSRASPVFQAASSASPDVSPSTSMPTYTVGTNGDMEAFLSDIMGDNPIPPDIMDDEYYAFGGYGSDVDSMDGDEDTNISTAKSIDIDPFDYVYSKLPDSTHILKHAANCDHCKARKFESETDGFCCRNGQIELKEPDPIPELIRLWSSTDADSRHIRENIWFFNGHFAFTTLGVSLDENYTNMKSGVYTFRAHGTIYHNVHSFGPSSRPEHLQLYFYDDDPNLTHRKAATKQLDQNVVKQLVDILRGNPYSQQFRSLGAHKDNLDDYRIDLNTDQRLDQCRYNRPVSSEVAAIWVEGADLAKRFDRRITLCGNDNQRHSIRVTDGSYDPLSYPLFYPMGELGWHPRLPKRNVLWEVVQQPREGRDDDEDAEGSSRLCVSMRDYYCYRLQTRPAIFNPILCGARLLQQWGADMYIKIESCRLRWYRKNQTKIRADLYKGVVDAITSGETRASAVGVRIVLPGKYPGGDRDMKRRQMDAMAIVHTYGKPDIFLTMTCNPNWEEMSNELFPGQTAQDRPDLVARVFHGKL